MICDRRCEDCAQQAFRMGDSFHTNVQRHLAYPSLIQWFANEVRKVLGQLHSSQATMSVTAGVFFRSA